MDDAIKISAVIITFNEEKNIERCLSSLKDIVDEIVVLDSGSTDKTKELCEKYNVKFYTHAFDGHIQQKNRAKDLAAHDWVLSLDADEALDTTLQKSILSLKENNGFTKSGYYMNRLTNYCGHWVKHCNWYPDKKLRLWNRTKGQWTGTNPHDKFEMFEGDKTTRYLKGDILHYSYYTLDDHYKQVEYFTNIAAKAYTEQERTVGFWNLIFNPIAKFIDHYLLHLGFLDGTAGWNISKISAYATYLKYKKIIDMRKKNTILKVSVYFAILMFILSGKSLLAQSNYKFAVVGLQSNKETIVSNTASIISSKPGLKYVGFCTNHSLQVFKYDITMYADEKTAVEAIFSLDPNFIKKEGSAQDIIYYCEFNGQNYDNIKKEMQ